MHLSGIIKNFSTRERLRGAVPPTVNVGPLIYRLFCSLTTLRQIIFMFFILAFLRHVCCQGHGSRSNVVVSYVKETIMPQRFAVLSS